MGGGSQQTSQSQQSQSQNTLPSWLTSAYQGSLGNASSLLGAGLGATSGLGTSLLGSGLSSIAGVNPQSIGAADSTLSSILGGNYNTQGTAQMNAANPAIQSEAAGSLMNVNSNPYLQSTYNLGLQGIQNNVDSQFGTAGRNVLASAPVQADQASTLADSLLGGQYATNLNATQNAQSLASGNYNTGVGAINTAAGISPSVTSGLYTPGTTQLSAGLTPFNLQSWYSGLLGQTAAPFGQNSSSGSGTSTTTMTGNPLTEALGGSLGLMGLLTGNNSNGLLGLAGVI